MVGKLPYFWPAKRVFVKMKRYIFLWNKCIVIEPHSHVPLVRIGSAHLPLVNLHTCHTERRDTKRDR
jgi:hypothetical protein